MKQRGNTQIGFEFFLGTSAETGMSSALANYSQINIKCKERTINYLLNRLSISILNSIKSHDFMFD